MASPLLFSFFFITVAFNRQEKKKPGGCFHSNRKPIGPEEKRERDDGNPWQPYSGWLNLFSTHIYDFQIEYVWEAIDRGRG